MSEYYRLFLENKMFGKFSCIALPEVGLPPPFGIYHRQKIPEPGGKYSCCQPALGARRTVDGRQRAILFYGEPRMVNSRTRKKGAKFRREKAGCLGGRWQVAGRRW
jgi:hypothetical protein